MSIEAKIRKRGLEIIHVPGPSANPGVFDPASGKVVAPVPTQRKIRAVLDGFGSLESQLRADEYKTGQSEADGSLRVFTTTKLMGGDTVIIEDRSYVLKYVKQVWKKDRIVLYEGVAEL